MSGSEVTQAIRADPELRSCRLVLLTSAGASRPPDVERSLTKPVRRAALLQTLAEALTDAEPTAETPARSAIAVRGTVLVAEDNPVNQLVIETLLRRRGLTVEIAADGLEAVQRFDPERHDAIFMDCQMPNLDGYQATARIRAAGPADRHIPIVAMTAHAFASDRDRCLRAGMDDYLSKPLRSEDLDPVLERWLADATTDLSDDGPVDGERLSSVRDVSPELVGRLVDVFARTTPPLLDELRAAVERGERSSPAACAQAARQQRRRRRPAPLGARPQARELARTSPPPPPSWSGSTATRSVSFSSSESAPAAPAERPAAALAAHGPCRWRSSRARTRHSRVSPVPVRVSPSKRAWRAQRSLMPQML